MIGTLFRLTEPEQKTLAHQIQNHLNSHGDVGNLLQKVHPSGAKFRYLCTNFGNYGWHSDAKGYRYTQTHPTLQKPWAPMPEFLLPIIEKAKTLAGEPSFDPQSCLVNFYRPGDTLGLHQDKTEVNKQAMILSISLGHSATFATAKTYTGPKTRTTLRSGDISVMSGKDRMIWHGVEEILPDCPWLPHRINLTIRQVY